MNYYAQAIEILRNRPHYKKMLFEIAKKNPKALFDAHERLNGPISDSKIVNMVKDGYSKIECITEYRRLTGAGLKQSKKHVESLYP